VAHIGTVLVVDDERATLDMLTDLLTFQGYHVEQATTGVEGLQKAQQQLPDAILLDLMMPGMSGFEVCQCLRRDPHTADVPVIVLTGFGTTENLSDSIDAGADDFITKPVRASELLLRLSTNIRIRQRHRLTTERARFKQVVACSVDGIAVVDGSGIVRTANAALAHMLGLSSQDDITGTALANMLTPDQVEPTQAYLSVAMDRQAKAASLETWLTRGDGTALPVEIVAGPFDLDDKPAAIISMRNITRRRQIEQDLAHEQYLFNILMDTVPDHIYFKDANGHFTKVNRSLAMAFGLSDPVQCLGKADGDFFDKVHAEKAQADERQIMMSGQPLVGEEEEETWLDGHKTWVWTTKMPLRDADGSIIGTFGISRDIAKRRADQLALEESQRTLQESEQFNSIVLESIPSSLVVIDRGLCVVSANRNFLDKARRGLASTLGRRIDEVLPRVLLEYTQIAQKAQEVFRTGQPIDGGKASYRAPGLATRIYYYRLIPLKPANDVNHVMLLLDDITERELLGEEMRRAERHLAGVVECANDLVVSLDPQARITTWNRAAENASGLNAETVVGRSVIELCSAEDQSTIRGVLKEVVAGEQVNSAEADLQTAEGRRLPIAWNFSRMQDDVGHTIGVVAVGRDLTERRLWEAQVTQSSKMASLGVMARGIAHELRNPLGIISAVAQLLEEYRGDAAMREECVQKILVATRRSSLIIESLLKFASPHGEDMQPVNVNTVVERTLLLLAHETTMRRVKRELDLQQGIPAIAGHAGLLQQVLTNLVLNACNAMMPDGGCLTVATRAISAKRSKGGGMVEIQISDTGCGIAPEHLPRIFDPFFTTQPTGKGYGLGLSISYSIIHEHHGAIQVQSQLGQGTDFIIRLPALSDNS
jgi:PAS domain S-box-containing protein